MQKTRNTKLYTFLTVEAEVEHFALCLRTEPTDERLCRLAGLNALVDTVLNIRIP